MTDYEDSVSTWLERLPDGDSYAQSRIWERYAEQVTRLARRFLHGVQRRDSDEEDIAVQVLTNLYRRMAQGDFENVTNRQQLWALLLGMTRNKAAEAARRKMAQKRGGGAVSTESALINPSDSIVNGIDQVPDHQMTPDSIVFQSEQFGELIDCLEHNDLRQAAFLRMAGYSNEEISKSLGVTERTVERKFEKIRINF